MSFAEELRREVSEIFRTRWDSRDGNVVPTDDSLKLGNDGIRIEGTVLYTDLVDSTTLVDAKRAEFSSEVYKAFLRIACKIIAKAGGSITAFDGDRVMAVFIGESKNTSAVRSALQINWAVEKIINPALFSQYSSSSWTLKHGTGIDTSNLLVSRSGIRGANDLIWVGPAANYAAKLSTLREGFSTWISHPVFNALNNSAKYDDQKNVMWESCTWSKYNRTVYRSNHYWSVS